MICDECGVREDCPYETAPLVCYKVAEEIEKLRKPKTNADAIRNMTDEELEVFLSNITADALFYGAGMRKEPKTVIGHKISWIKWLKEEVKG